nr:MAG TPA: hypothetical protein [Bacteriophage sp.]
MLFFLVLAGHLDVTRIGCAGELDALLAVVSHALHEILTQVFWLLSGYHFGDYRHVQALFVGDAGRGKVNVYFVLLFRAFGCYVVVRHRYLS